MSAVNECPRCRKLAEPEPGQITRMYDGVCVACWRLANPGKPLPAVPSQEFFPPTRLAESVLFKQRMFEIWDARPTRTQEPSSVPSSPKESVSRPTKGERT